jgi:diguanylate cyclase (GGDEF)-like protein
MRILIAEDDPVSRRHLARVLTRWKYEVLETSNGAQAWEMLERSDAPQLAILDWMMPGLDGLQVCRKVREQNRSPYTYLILLTARDRKTDIAAGMEGGADDYLTKPFDAQELRARLHAGCRILDLQSRLFAALETLRDQAAHDALTHLWNHDAILDVLQRELARSHRDDRPVSVIMADLDRFKEINDTYGHQAGDFVLQEVSHRMRLSVRPYDRVGRYGGEEFMIVLADCDLAGARSVAERVRLRIGGEPVLSDSVPIHVTISLGVATCLPGTAVNGRGLIRAADIALYRAKNGGRDRVDIALPEDLAAGRPLLGELSLESVQAHLSAL